MRHLWRYPVDRYSAKSRTCERCGMTARTFGVGAGRIWSHTTAAGVLIGARPGPCTPA